MNVYKITNIEKVENGFLVEYWSSGDKKQVFAKRDDMIAFVNEFFKSMED